jgi:signal transduction histidine kinase
MMNALDACPSADAWLKASRDGGRVSLALKDNGVGIEPEKLKGLFEPFATGRAEQGGTGLGLNVARWIMHKHGGDVAIASEGIGKGTTVTLALQAA